MYWGKNRAGGWEGSMGVAERTGKAEAFRLAASASSADRRSPEVTAVGSQPVFVQHGLHLKNKSATQLISFSVDYHTLSTWYDWVSPPPWIFRCSAWDGIATIIRTYN